MLASPESAARRALIVDDAAESTIMVRSSLESEGFEVSSCETGTEGIQLARQHDPLLIVLDLGLPDMDGVEVCRQIRTFSEAYVIMLTARDEEMDKVIGLTVGADDYVVKPFSVREFTARVRALLRRDRPPGTADDGDGQANGERIFGDLWIEPLAREVKVNGESIDLTKIQFDLLEALTSRPRVVFTRGMLLERIWGENWYGDDHVVDVHMADLRKRLGDDPRDPRYIRTVRGVGYRMADPSRSALSTEPG